MKETLESIYEIKLNVKKNTRYASEFESKYIESLRIVHT